MEVACNAFLHDCPWLIILAHSIKVTSHLLNKALHGLVFMLSCLLQTDLAHLGVQLLEIAVLSCRVNWTQAKCSSLIKPGDVISCSGKGRVEVISSSLTKKGRHAVEMMRYL